MGFLLLLMYLLTRMKMKRSKSILIIDGQNLAYRAHYKFSLTTDSGRPSGVAYGFLYILASVLRKLPSSQVHVAFDGGRSPLRKEIWPEYKKRDDKLQEDKELFYEQIKDLREVLPGLGCHTYHYPEYEADDIIFQIWKANPNRVKTILSSDKDFVQLLDPYTKILNPFKDRIVSTINVKKEYGFSEREIVDYLILKGDKSDNIPGVHGMGDKRIRDFLDQFGSIQNFLDEGHTMYLNKYPIKEANDRNRKLIWLMWHYIKDKSRILPVFKPFVGIPNDFIKKYQLRSFIKSEFLNPFRSL